MGQRALLPGYKEVQHFVDPNDCVLRALLYSSWEVVLRNNQEYMAAVHELF